MKPKPPSHLLLGDLPSDNSHRERGKLHLLSEVDGGVRSAISVDLGDVGENWPLISFLRDDPVYFQIHRDYLEDFLANGFAEDDVADTFTYYHDLISPYVTAEDPETTLISSWNAFERSADELIDHVGAQTRVAETFLEND